MKASNLKIGIEIEPIVMLTCINKECRFRRKFSLTCNFKEIRIEEDGKCGSMEIKFDN